MATELINLLPVAVWAREGGMNALVPCLAAQLTCNCSLRSSERAGYLFLAVLLPFPGTWVNIHLSLSSFESPTENLLGKVAGKIPEPMRTEFKGYLAARSQRVASSHQNDNLPGHGLLEVLPRDDGLHPQRGLLFFSWISGRQGGRAR